MKNKKCMFLYLICLKELLDYPQDIPSSLTRAYPEANASSYVGASYVKWVESAGARAAPVLLGRDVRYYREEVFDKINGLLIPGGGVSLFNSGGEKMHRYQR